MRFLVALVVLAIVAMPSKASTLLLEQSVLDAALATRYSEPMSRDGRLRTARAMLAYWIDFDSRIPRNSPAEASWLEQELQSNENNRVGRAMVSPQYAIWRLSVESSNCVVVLKALVPLVGGDKTAELYAWLRATACYQSVETTSNYLQIAGLTGGSKDDTFEIEFFPAVLSAINTSIANGVIADPS